MHTKLMNSSPQVPRKCFLSQEGVPVKSGVREKHFKWGVQDVPHLRKWLLSTGLQEVEGAMDLEVGWGGRTFQAEKNQIKGPQGTRASPSCSWKAVGEGTGD